MLKYCNENVRNGHMNANKSRFNRRRLFYCYTHNTIYTFLILLRINEIIIISPRRKVSIFNNCKLLSNSYEIFEKILFSLADQTVFSRNLFFAWLRSCYPSNIAYRRLSHVNTFDSKLNGIVIAMI